MGAMTRENSCLSEKESLDESQLNSKYDPRIFDRIYRARMGLREMAAYVHEISVSKGWWDKENAPADLIANVHAELSEAWEEHRNGHPDDEVYHQDGKPSGFVVELADAVIRILDYCAGKKIDIATVICIKSEFNQTRPYRHGGKLA